VGSADDARGVLGPGCQQGDLYRALARDADQEITTYPFRVNMPAYWIRCGQSHPDHPPKEDTVPSYLVRLPMQIDADSPVEPSTDGRATNAAWTSQLQYRIDADQRQRKPWRDGRRVRRFGHPASATTSQTSSDRRRRQRRTVPHLRDWLNNENE